MVDYLTGYSLQVGYYLVTLRCLTPVTNKSTMHHEEHEQDAADHIVHRFAHVGYPGVGGIFCLLAFSPWPPVFLKHDWIR